MPNPCLSHRMPGPELGSSDTEVQRCKGAQSESEQERMPCTLTVLRPRVMPFQAAATRRVNRKVNSSQCPWPVVISDD